MNATGGVHRTPHRTHAYAHFSRALFTRDDCTCGSSLSVLRVSQNHSISDHVSLLKVPCCRVAAILSSPTCSLTLPSASSTPLTGIRRPPLCLSAVGWDVWPSGQSDSRHSFANKTRDRHPEPDLNISHFSAGQPARSPIAETHRHFHIAEGSQ